MNGPAHTLMGADDVDSDIRNKCSRPDFGLRTVDVGGFYRHGLAIIGHQIQISYDEHIDDNRSLRYRKNKR